MNFNKNDTIAIIDSGIGGVSVLKQIISNYGGGNFIYYADNNFMPYGNKSKTFINTRLNYIINLLQKTYNVSCILIACNTASTCIDAKKYKNVYSMKFDKNLTYYATKLTKKNLLGYNVIADKNLPKLIETYIFNKPQLKSLIRAHIKAKNLNAYDTLVLGCTHYELVYDIFQANCKNTHFICNSQLSIQDITFNSCSTINIILLMSKYSKSFKDKFYRILSI